MHPVHRKFSTFIFNDPYSRRHHSLSLCIHCIKRRNGAGNRVTWRYTEVCWQNNNIWRNNTIAAILSSSANNCHVTVMNLFMSVVNVNSNCFLSRETWGSFMKLFIISVDSFNKFLSPLYKNILIADLHWMIYCTGLSVYQTVCSIW